MPLYEFKCVECGHVTEKFYHSRDAMLNDGVRECRQGDCIGILARLISTAAIIVRGFSSANGYSGGQTYEVKSKEKGMRVMVKS